MNKEEIKKVFDRWNNGYSCPSHKKTFLWSDGEYGLFHHNSHVTYTGRMSGSSTCTAYTALLRLDSLSNSHYNRGILIKKWEGRSNKERVEEAIEIVKQLKEGT